MSSTLVENPAFNAHYKFIVTPYMAHTIPQRLLYNIKLTLSLVVY